MSDVSVDSDDILAELNDNDQFSIPDDFNQYSDSSCELSMLDLRQICLRTLAIDHVLKIHVEKVKDLPKHLIQELLEELSVFGLHLLESHGILNDPETRNLWKKHTDHLYCQFISGRHHKYKIKDGFKSFFFQSLFSKMVELVKDYDLLPLAEPKTYLYRFRTVMDMQDSKIFNLGGINDAWSVASMENFISLFKSNLVRIPIYPYLLHHLFSLSEATIMNGITENIRHVEFHDFFRFKDHHMWKIKDFLHPLNFPYLTSLSFMCCKFNKEAIRDFRSVIDSYIDDGSAIDSKETDQASVITSSAQHSKENLPAKRVPIDTNLAMEDAVEVPIKKPRSEDGNNDVSFDDALLYGVGVKTEADEQIHDIYDFNSVFNNNKDSNAAEESDCRLNCLEFINCEIPEKAINTLSKLVGKIPLLKTFTLQPEYPLHCSLHKVFATAFGRALSLPFQEIDDHTSCLEVLRVHDCHLDYYCKKLLFWHLPEECKQQHGVLVPSLRHLEIVDCNLDTYQFACNCLDFTESFSKTTLCPNASLKERNPLKLPEPHHNSDCVEAFNWYFDPPKACTCNWKRLEVVDLSGNYMKFKGIEAIALALKEAKNLTSLKLIGCRLDTKGLKSIFTMASAHPSLKALDISDNAYSTDEDDSLSILIKDGNLTRLAIRNCIATGGLTDGLVSAFASNSKIVDLDIGNNRLGSEGMNKFSGILTEPSTLSALKVLNIAKNQMKCSAMTRFALALQKSGRAFDDLVLSGNAIDVVELKNCGLCHVIDAYVKTWDMMAPMPMQYDGLDHVSEM